MTQLQNLNGVPVEDIQYVRKLCVREATGAGNEGGVVDFNATSR